MNDKNRRATATATLGLTGVGSAAAMRHVALERAYKKGKRPPVLQELKMLKNGTKGRGLYAAGMATGLVATPAAVSGVSARLSNIHKEEKKRRSFLAEGVSGVRHSIAESNTTVHNPPPAKLALANYLGGGAVTAGAGALVNHGLKGAKLPGAAKAAIAAGTAVSAGAATLPIQSKLMGRFSGGEYESTAHGVRRKKTRPTRPSSKAITVNAAGVPTPVGKYYGEDLSHRQKRARVAAVTGLPVVSDVAQAGQAARMAPPELRTQTGLQVYGGGQAGGAAGSTAGAYGAVALARRSKKFEEGSEKVNDLADNAKAKIRESVRMKPKAKAASRAERVAAHTRTPKVLSRAIRPLIGHGKVAAVGAFAGGAMGGQLGSQTGYGAALRAEDRYKAKVAKSSQSARHGSRVAKGDAPVVMTPRQQEKLSRAKKRNAVGSQLGGAIGLTALGATLGTKVKALGPRTTARLAKVPVPLLTTGAGLSGANSFGYAAIQNKEAGAKVKKALMPVPGIARRAPAGFKGSLRQTRNPGTGAIRTSYTRGGIR